jgi:NitT/TauT family transport system substrate-binding protein
MTLSVRGLAIGAALLVHSAAFAQEKVLYLNDWLPAGDKAPVYIAAAKGLFAAEGLEVTIQSGRGSSDVVTKLGTGVADMGQGGISALLQAKAQSGVPVTAIYSIYTKQPDAIFTPEGSGITSLKDLAGRKIATATFSASNVSWPLVLQANAIDPAKVELLKVDPGALAPMLASGKVDGTISWVTTAPVFEGPLAEASKKLKIIPWSGYGFDGYGLSLFVSDKMLKERPETVKKFLKAYIKATELANADPALAGVSVKSMVPEVNAETAAKQWTASIPLIVNEISKKDGFGAFEPGLLAKTWEWVAKAQNIPAGSFDPEKAVDRSFLK